MGRNGLYQLPAEVLKKHLNSCLILFRLKYMLKDLCSHNQTVYLLLCWGDQVKVLVQERIHPSCFGAIFSLTLPLLQTSATTFKTTL